MEKNIKLRLKKDCTGCRAFDGSSEPCALHYEKDGYTPLENCEKPRSYDKLIELLKIKK